MTMARTTLSESGEAHYALGCGWRMGGSRRVLRRGLNECGDLAHRLTQRPLFRSGSQHKAKITRMLEELRPPAARRPQPVTRRHAESSWRPAEPPAFVIFRS